MIYLDTSALLPFYRRDAASQAFENLFLSSEQPLLISDLLRIALASALSCWVRMDELTEA